MMKDYDAAQHGQGCRQVVLQKEFQKFWGTMHIYADMDDRNPAQNDLHNQGCREIVLQTDSQRIQGHNVHLC